MGDRRQVEAGLDQQDLGLVVQIPDPNGFLTREIVAKATLGLDLDEQPRWG